MNGGPLTPDRRTLLSIFAIAFGLRVLYAAVIGSDPDVIANPLSYQHQVASMIAAGSPWLGAPVTPNAPGYILVLALVYSIAGSHLWLGLLLNAFLGATTTVFLYRIGERRLAPGVGLLAAVWLGITVHQIHFASVLGRYVLVVFLWVWIFHIITQHFSRMRAAVWLGILVAVLLHVEPMFMLLVPVFALGFLAFATRHRLLNVQFTLLFVSTVLMVSLPWAIRNALVYREPIPIALEAIQYTGPFTGVFVQKNPEMLQELQGPHPRPTPWHNTVELWRVVRLTDSPGDAARGVAPQSAWSLRHNLISLVNYGLLLPFLVTGVVIGWRRRNRAALALTMGVAGYWLLRAVYGANESARLPVEPLIILLAFYGAASILARRRRNRTAGVDST